MLDTEPSYCDAVSLEDRVRLMEPLFADVEKSTGGVFNLERLLNAKKILDVGIGRGALGQFIRDKGAKGEIVGVEKVSGYCGKTGYDKYSRIDWKDVKDPKELDKLSGEEFDLVIAVGIPDRSAEFLAGNFPKFKLSPKGLMIIILDKGDYINGELYGFNNASGDFWIDGSIYWKEK